MRLKFWKPKKNATVDSSDKDEKIKHLKELSTIKDEIIKSKDVKIKDLQERLSWEGSREDIQ